MSASILILAFGNPGRQDDGLGPRCAELLEQQSAIVRKADVRIEIDYQLTVEDALPVSQADYVVFIDAAIDLDTGYRFTPVEANPQASFSSHLLAPHGLLYLAENLFGHSPKAFLLSIKGYEFAQFEEALSQQAEINLHKAFNFLHKQLLAWVKLPKAGNHA